MAEIKGKLKNWWQERSGRRLTEPKRVSPDVLHLFRLRREHRLLRVKIAGLEGDFQSLVLEVDLQGQRLLLDEPFPPREELAVLAGRKIQVTSIEGAASTQFEARALGAVSHRGHTVLATEIPLSVLAAQRRSSYRIAVDEHTAIHAILRHSECGNLAARVLDLSSHGIRFEVPGEHAIAGSDPAQLFLRIGSEQGMLCELKVCSLFSSTLKESTQVGGQFLGLNPPQKQTIERFVVRTQRAQRQREIEVSS